MILKSGRIRLKKELLIKIAAVLVGILLVVQFINQRAVLARIEKDIKDKNIVIEELQKKNEEMKKELEKVNSDEYIEKTARERFQMIKPGDIPVTNSPGKSSDTQPSGDTTGGTTDGTNN